jgi:hypothetical protein
MSENNHDSSMRVMTWNIWHHFGPWQQRQVAIEQVIKDENPDVLF